MMWQENSLKRIEEDPEEGLGGEGWMDGAKKEIKKSKGFPWEEIVRQKLWSDRLHWWGLVDL